MIENIVTPEGATYYGWQSDEHGVGYRAVHDDGRTEYVYVKPAVNDQGVPVVRVYVDTTGDATSEPTEYEAFPDGASSMTGIKVSDRVLLGAIEIAGVLFLRFTDGWAIGWEMVNTNVAGGVTTCFYLNASGEADDGQPNVFAYHGPHGSPALDHPVAHFDVFRPEVEDMGRRNGYGVQYRRADQTYVISDPDDVEFEVNYERICDLSELIHELDHDATRRAFTEPPAGGWPEPAEIEHLNCPLGSHIVDMSHDVFSTHSGTAYDGNPACKTCGKPIFFCTVAKRQGDEPYAHVYENEEKACPTSGK